MNEHPHVVIVGAGFGGLNLARRLKRGPFRVTLVDRENHHLFQPLLYQVATAGLSPGDIAVPVRALFEKCDNVQVLMAEAEGADFDNKLLLLKDCAPLSYDYLVVAAGAETNYYGNDQWKPIAPGLKSIRDAVGIREKILSAFEQAELEQDEARLQQLLTFVVIGGGPTGVEMAGAISELARHTLRREFRRFDPTRVKVMLVEMMDRVLGPFDPSLSKNAEEQLKELGVEVCTGAKVEEIKGQGVTVDGTFHPAALVCWATGVKPVPLAEKLGVETTRGHICVEQDCSVKGQRDVFAIGDIAAYFPEGAERPLPGVAPVAIQQGRYLAKLFKRRLKGKPDKPFNYVDKGMMATVGRSRAVAESKGIKLTGTLAWLAWLAVHLLYLVGFKNRYIVLVNWIYSYATYNRGARLIAHHYRHGPETTLGTPSERAAPAFGKEGAESPRDHAVSQQASSHQPVSSFSAVSKRPTPTPPKPVVLSKVSGVR